MSQRNPTDDDVAQFVLAKRRAEDVQSYLSRGRQCRELDDTELANKFVDAMRDWASDPTDAVRRQTATDVRAEYDLRGSEPPYKTVAAELKAIKTAAKRVVEQWTEERHEEISREMYDEYMAAKKGQH